MSANKNGLSDEDGNTPDWIEIYNSTDTAINLHNYGLSDDEDDLQKWLFPEKTILSKEYLVIFASGKNRKGSELHTNFSIKSSGEPLFLSYDNRIVHQAPPTSLKENFSLIFYPSDTTSFVISQTATPRNPNKLFEADEVYSSKNGGIYEEVFYLELKSKYNNQIRYTIDGSLPTSQSLLYSNPLLLNSSLTSPINISQYLITPPKQYLPPSEGLPKAIVIRAASFNDNGEIVSEIITNSYFIKSMNIEHSLPIISLTLPYDGIFDDSSGIMVPGIHWDSDNPEWTGNYYQRGDEWEREIYAEFFEQNGAVGFSQAVGLRTHGGNSRRDAQKALKIYARDDYDNDDFSYKLFDDRPTEKFKRLVLGAATSSWSSAGMEDFLANKLARELQIETVASRPVILYLNGEYWGLYYFEEKIDNHYIATHNDIDTDSVDIIGSATGNIDEGSNEEFLKLYQFVETADFRNQTDYLTFLEDVDIENFIDYYLFEMYIANIDWPSNNYALWKPKNKGKWKWIFFDGDAGLQRVNHNSLLFSMEESEISWPNNKTATLFFRQLMQNETFRTQFFNRIEQVLNSTLSYDSILPYYVEALDNFSTELDRMIQRFEYPVNAEDWVRGTERVKKFIQIRPCVMRQQILDEYHFLIDIPECDNSINSLSEIDLFPNPNNGDFRIRFEAQFASLLVVKVIDMFGRVQAEKEVLFTSGVNDYFLSFDNLEDGIYVFTFQIGTQIITRKGSVIKN